MIESEILAQVSDIIISPPKENMYETLKKKLIQRYAESEQHRLRKLLQNIDIGDRRPIELLREMKQLAGGTVSSEFLKSIWSQQLPDQMRMILSTNDGDIDQLAKMADKIAEVSNGFSNVSAVSSNTSSDRTSRLEKQIELLTKQIASLATQVSDRSRSSSYKRSNKPRHFNRDRSSSRFNQTPSSSSANQICYFHKKFGNDAKKFRSPCKFSSSENFSASR